MQNLQIWLHSMGYVSYLLPFDTFHCQLLLLLVFLMAFCSKSVQTPVLFHPLSMLSWVAQET